MSQHRGAGATFFRAPFWRCSIRGIEINPAIFEVLTDKFADFSGHLDKQPGVSLVNAEARSYINHSPDKYDLVQISLIDTWAATAAGGLTLTENRLYTVEAFNDFYRALKPGGLLSVSRSVRSGMTHRGEFYRLVAIAANALQNNGVAATDFPAHHVIALNVGNIVTVITRPDAFTDAQWQGAHETARARLQDIARAGCRLRRSDDDLDIGQGRRRVFRSAAGENQSSTDDNPFFFYTEPSRRSLRGPFDAFDEQQRCDHDDTRARCPHSVRLRILCILVPFCSGPRRMPLATLSPPVVYFSAIGMGFMLIEVSQMQRLMVFLGHPVLWVGRRLSSPFFSSAGSAAPRSVRLPLDRAWSSPGSSLCWRRSRRAGLLTPVPHDMGAIGSNR